MSKSYNLSLVDMGKRLVAGELCPVALTEEALAQAKKKESLNAFITLAANSARERAEKSRQKLKDGKGGRLEGIPIAYKDMFCTKGLRTTAGSKMLKNFVPPYSAHVVELLEKEGAICIGKCNQDEFAMGSASTTGFTGEVVNSIKEEEQYSAGGSSGGSAVAVAANIVPAALGTDTGGSVRQPAAFTGCVGVKPTYGRCSRFGIIAYASSLDQAGVFARSVEDAAVVLECAMGYDERDMTSVSQSVPNLVESCKQEKPLKIGILLPTEIQHKNLPTLPIWREKLNNLLDNTSNFKTEELEEEAIPSISTTAYYIIAMAEASSNLARYDGVRYGYRANKPQQDYSLDDMICASRGEGLGFEVQRRILMGTHVLSSGYYDAIYVQAQKVRRLVFNAFNNIFKTYDILLSPVSPCTAFPLKQVEENKDMMEWMYFQDLFTVPASLAGLPCMSLPLTEDERGLPIGLQLIAPPFQEERLFSVASQLEAARVEAARDKNKI